jgi:hypothetical protein
LLLSSSGDQQILVGCWLLGAKRVCPDLLWFDSITTTTTTTPMISDQCAIISEEALARLNHHPPVAHARWMVCENGITIRLG